MLGQETIMARIIESGKPDIFQELPISLLRSPKPLIEINNLTDIERFSTTLEQTRAAAVDAKNAINVTGGGSGTPMPDVILKYLNSGKQ